ADILLNSLPLRRHEIVLAKYLSIFVYSAIGIAIYLLVAAATKVLGFPIHVYPINFKAVIYGILAVSFLNGIYLPL
ncbi:ABC-2 transporter permease, partial [Rhizobium sp. KAs_5_22]